MILLLSTRIFDLFFILIWLDFELIWLDFRWSWFDFGWIWFGLGLIRAGLLKGKSESPKIFLGFRIFRGSY